MKNNETKLLTFHFLVFHKIHKTIFKIRYNDKILKLSDYFFK